MKKITGIKLVIIKFGSVGFISYLVNLITFNILVYFKFSPLYQSSKIGTLIAGLLSILVAFIGNRNWTWKNRNFHKVKKQIALFILVNLLAIIFNLLLLYIFRDILLIRSQLVDNIIVNIIGQVIGTIFRFYMYNKVIFKQ